MEEAKVKVSVIIPCYNVEKYIDRCIESLVNQTIGIENLELIFVNDASTDNTLDKLKIWENRYPENIMIITYDENLKQGGARNVGMQYASADYIGFVDSDDWVEPNMYELLFNQIVQGDYDVVKCKCANDYGQGECVTYWETRKDQEYKFNKKNGVSLAVVTDVGINGSYSGVYTGIYKKSLIFDNDIFFPEHIVYEDNYWTSILDCYVTKLYIIDLVLYHYFLNENSTLHSNDSPHHIDRLAIEEMVIEKYEKLGIINQFYPYVMEKFIKRYYLNSYYIFFIRLSKQPIVYSRIRNNIYKYFPDWYKYYHFSTEPLANKLLLKELMTKETDEEFNVEDVCNEYLKLAYYEINLA